MSGASRGSAGSRIKRSENLRTNRRPPIVLPPRLDLGENRELWRHKLASADSMIMLDLFCGAGGLSLGFEQAGFTVGAGFDYDRSACETFRANILAEAHEGDLREVEPEAFCESIGVERVDVIVGGPPCQGFSQAGLARIRQLGDQIAERIERRNALYRQFVKFVARLKPLIFVMENVPHLGNHRDGETARQIQEDFREAGYRVSDAILLDAPDFGVPQMRRRLFFVGVQDHLGWVFRTPRPTHGPELGIPHRTLADAISDLPSRQAPSWDEVIPYTRRQRPDLEELLGRPIDHEYATLMRSQLGPGEEGLLYDHVVRDVRDDDREIFALMKPGGLYRDVPEHLRRYHIKSGSNGDLHFEDRYYRLQWDRPCVSILAHMAKDGYRYIYPDNDQIRTLSIREAARIQSFPDHFQFAGYRSHRIQQIGNAVPPLLAQALAQRVADVVRGARAGTLVELDHQKGLPGFDDLLLKRGA